MACVPTGHSAGWFAFADAQVACGDTGHGERELFAHSLIDLGIAALRIESSDAS